MSANKKFEVEVFNCLLDKFISSANEEFYALKLFHFNFELMFYLMDKNYLTKLPENNLKAICLTTAEVIGFNENEGLNLLKEVTSFVFLTCKEDFLKKFNASDSFVINNLTSALKALKYIV